VWGDVVASSALGETVTDVWQVLLILAVFGLLAFVGKGAEKL
jgi:hypothetical protein